MRKAISRTSVVLTIGLAAGELQQGAVAAQAPPGAARAWEYRVLTKEQVKELGMQDLSAGLNQLGDEGWELAAVDGGYIFKRPKRQKTLEEKKQQVAVAEADLDAQKDRVAWSARMVKKGLISETQLQAERARLDHAQMTLERAIRELKAKLLPEPKKAPDGDRPPGK